MSVPARARVPRDPATGINLRFLSVACGLGGLAILVGSVYVGMWAGALMTGILWGFGLVFHLTHFVRPRTDRRVQQELGPDGVRLRAGLRPQRPLVLLDGAAVAAMMCWLGVLLTESPVGHLLLACCSPVVAGLVGPDSVRALAAHGRGVFLTPRSLSYRGWSYDVEVPWEKVLDVFPDLSNPYLICLRVVVSDAEPLQPSRHKIVVGLDPAPAAHHFLIPLVALDSPDGLIRAARHMIDVAPEDRHRCLAEHGLAILSGDDPGTACPRLWRGLR